LAYPQIMSETLQVRSPHRPSDKQRHKYVWIE